MYETSVQRRPRSSEFKNMMTELKQVEKTIDEHLRKYRTSDAAKPVPLADTDYTLLVKQRRNLRELMRLW